MKILFCPTHYVYDESDRGSELSWAFQIADTIAKKNPKSAVVTGFKNIKSKKLYRIIELQKMKKSIDLGVANALKFNLSYSRFANSIMEEEKFDVLHHVLPFSIDTTFNFSFITSPTSIAKIVGPIQSPLPYYKDNMEDYNAKKKNDYLNIGRFLILIFKPLLRSLSQQTLKKADKIIVINQKTKNLLTHRGIDKNKMVIIPPGVDTKVFAPASRKASKSIELLAVGALIERKGFDTLLTAVSDVAKRHNNVRLKIVGDGPQRAFLKKLVKILKIEKNVFFQGHIPHHKIALHFKKADIFLNASRAEGFATVCLEAMAAGLPIISTKVGGFADAVKNDKNGFLVNIDDSDAFAERLVQLVENEEMMKSMSLNSRVLAEEKYDWKKIIIPKYIKIYKDLTR